MDHTLDLSEVGERRRAELEFVSSAYSPSEAWTVPSLSNGDDEEEGLISLARSSPEVHRRLVLDDGVDIELVLTMPGESGYPVAESSVLSVGGSLCHDNAGSSLRKLAVENLPRFLGSCREAAEENPGCEAVFAVLSRADEWMEDDWRRQKEENQAADVKKSTETACNAKQNEAHGHVDAMQLHVVSSHHLLDHAPDNFLAKGGKYNLNGVYRFGTPGLAFCVGDRTDVENFVDGLAKKMPQKKFEVVLSRETDARLQGWEEATIDQLRSILTDEEFVGFLRIQGSSSNDGGKGGKGRKSKKEK